MTIQDNIAVNNLEWMSVFNDPTNAYKYAYRGSLVVIEGKMMATDKSLPPQEIIKQVLMATNNDTIDFLACELQSVNNFERFFDKYKEFFSPDGKYLLFISDINGKGKFVYEGITFYAYALDESSVWNDLVDLADLSKGDLKKMSDKEKIDAVCNEFKRTTLRMADSTLDEIKAMKRGSKASFGAV